MYTVFIDESGEAGISKVRTEETGGASPYMTLGAALVADANRQAIEAELINLHRDIGKNTLHCSRLSHYQIAYFARTTAKERRRFFGVISKKETLGQYKSRISEDSRKYYNKCAQYLLERIGWFIKLRKIERSSVKIVFETANVDYDQMKKFLRACQQNPQHRNTAWLNFIDVDNIVHRTKSDEPLLQLADLVAHALYKCVDKQPKNFGIPEPRYLKELSNRFFGHPNSGKVVGAGLYCVHSLRDVGLDDDVRQLLDSLIAAPASTEW